MANMKDIAQKAGVSIATVSKVLNGLGGISNETTERILTIAKELDYRPNLYARNLKKGKFHTIGIITEDLTVFNAPPIIDGIGAVCEESGYKYMLENMRINRLCQSSDFNEDKYCQLVRDSIDSMLSMQVDGIIYVSCNSYKILPKLFHQNIPFVCAYCNSASLAIPSVLYDDKKAAYDVTGLLIKQGHSYIGTITGPSDNVHTKNRLIGYQEALFDHKIPYNPYLTVSCDWVDRDMAYHATKDLLEQNVTAIFCQNDIIAVGVIDYCAKHNIRVGSDLAVFGFDNREISTVCRPTLSTVALPLTQIGHRSASILIGKIEGNSTVIGETYLDCEIIERESSRRHSL